MKTMQVLFIDETHPVLSEELEAMGFQCNFMSNFSKEALKKQIADYQGLVVRSKKIDKEILENADNLKFIARVGAGMENIDEEYASSKGIICLNSPEGNRDAVGEHSLAMLLNLFNNINKADKELRNGKWLREENRGLEIKGKTIGVFGYGNMGSAFAQRLKGFDCKVLAYDKYKEGYGNEFVEESNLESFMQKVDVVSFHIPLTEETNFLINDNFIKGFKKDIFIINTSRGKILKTDDLVKNLKTGKVRGACLDVFEYESTSFENFFQGEKNESFQYLIESEKAILTPHVAGWTHESKYKLCKVLADKIKEIKDQILP